MSLWWLPALLLVRSSTGLHVAESTRHCVAHYATALERVQPGLGSAIRSHPLVAEHTSDRSLILGAGSGTTGHRTVVTALRLLNVSSSYFALAPWKNRYFRTLDFSTRSSACLRALRGFDYTRVPENVDAIFDTPVAELFLDFFLAFPRAKVLLTTRNSTEWAMHRVRKDFGRLSPLPLQEPCGQFVLGHVKNITLLSSLFELNNALVRCIVPRDQLLEVNLWEDAPAKMQTLLHRLGAFVGRPVSEEGRAQKLKFAQMDENPDWPGNACEEPAHVELMRTGESVWAERLGSTMQALARRECDVVL